MKEGSADETEVSMFQQIEDTNWVEKEWVFQ